jgi:hypothetical protein
MTNRENAEEEQTGADAAPTDAPMDEVSAQPDAEAADDSEQNPPLPDWGPTDGVHGTDEEAADQV